MRDNYLLMTRYWPILFFTVPLIEIYLIIEVGSTIGVLWTVMLVILTAFIGVNLLRVQGLSTLQRAQLAMVRGQVPATEMMEGMVLAIGGVLLLTPGFLTDTLGLLCLFPLSRKVFVHKMLAHSHMINVGTPGDRPVGPGSGSGPDPGQDPGVHQNPGQPRGSRTIEGEFERHD